MSVRLNKLLSQSGVASRRLADELMRQGRVTVNGRVVTELGTKADPETDDVRVDGRRLKTRVERRYLLMNKPRGIYSTNLAQGEQLRAIDLLPPDFPRVYPVGRLDADSRGLLLLTNDGDLTNRLTHPRYGVPKTYRAVIDGYIAGEMAGAAE